MDYGEKIRLLRKERKLSTEKLGKIIGLSQSMVSKLENGERNIDVHVLEAIVTALGLTLSDFFSDQTTKLPPDIRQMVTMAQNLTPIQRELITSVMKEMAKDNLNDKLTYQTITPRKAIEDDAEYKADIITQIIEREYDIVYVCQLLDNEIIVLTDGGRNPLSPELRKDFVQYIKTHKPPELLGQVDIAENDALAAHRQGHLRQRHDGTKPELMALRRVSYKLNNILEQFMAMKTPNKETKKI